jgi:hypothetical protein
VKDDSEGNYKSGHDLFKALCWSMPGGREKENEDPVRIPGLQAEIRTKYLLYMKQKC